MKTAKIHKCHCGMTKPYRRAYACKKCWDGMKEEDKERLMDQRKGDGSLRLK